MSKKHCCEEMAELVKTFENKVESIKLRVNKNGEPESMIFLDDDVIIPNILFRFCPYCGTMAVADDVIPEEPVFDQVLKIIDNVDRSCVSQSYKIMAYEEAFSKMKSMIKSSIVKKEKPGFIKYG